MNKQFIGIIYLVLTAVLWGGAFISQLYGGEALGSYFFISLRCVFGCLTILVMIIFDNFIKHKQFTFFRKDENIKETLEITFFEGIILFFSMITQQLGIQLTDVAKAGIITSLEVIFVPIIMMIIYKQKISLITWIFVFTSMVGVMMLSINSISGINFGDFLVLIAAFLYAITVIQVANDIKKIDALKISFFRFAYVGIFSFFLSVIFNKESMTILNIKMALPSILYAGIVSSGIAYTFQILGQRYCNPVVATVIMGLEGVFAAIFGWIILGQTLTFIQILGCIIAVISTSVVQISDYFSNALNEK